MAIGVEVVASSILIYFMRIPEADRSTEAMKKKVRVRVGERREERVREVVITDAPAGATRVLLIQN